MWEAAPTGQCFPLLFWGGLREQPYPLALHLLLLIEIALESLTDVETLLINCFEDTLDVRNRSLLYDSCPYLAELNASLGYQSFFYPAFKTAGTTAHQLGGAG